MPRIIGLTGGIATGKSTVCRAWQSAGVAVVDADAIARDVVRPGRPALRLIRWAFGSKVIRPDGTLDRATLGRIIFSDQAKRRRLNRIMHPFIIAAMLGQLAYAVLVRFQPIVVLDTPLLYESGTLVPFCQTIVVVACSPDQQLARLMARSNKQEESNTANGTSTSPLTMEEAQARIAAQMPLAAKIARANHVVDNSQTIEITQATALGLLDELRPSPVGEACFRLGVIAVVSRVALGILRSFLSGQSR